MATIVYVHEATSFWYNIRPKRTNDVGVFLTPRYDLPTESEWEKAARGPEHDDQDEHLVYPWGNELSESCANYQSMSWTKPVGYYNGNQVPIGDDMVNGYGLYDVIGNVAEWTRSFGSNNLVDYPSAEQLSNSLCGYSISANRVIRGGGCKSGSSCYDYTGRCRIFHRYAQRENYYDDDIGFHVGFRVIRRVGVPE